MILKWVLFNVTFLLSSDRLPSRFKKDANHRGLKILFVIEVTLQNITCSKDRNEKSLFCTILVSYLSLFHFTPSLLVCLSIHVLLILTMTVTMIVTMTLTVIVTMTVKIPNLLSHILHNQSNNEFNKNIRIWISS